MSPEQAEGLSDHLDAKKRTSAAARLILFDLVTSDGRLPGRTTFEILQRRIGFARAFRPCPRLPAFHRLTAIIERTRHRHEANPGIRRRSRRSSQDVRRFLRGEAVGGACGGTLAANWCGAWRVIAGRPQWPFSRLPSSGLASIVARLSSGTTNRALKAQESRELRLRNDRNEVRFQRLRCAFRHGSSICAADWNAHAL
jgi:hypothetical protein